VQAPARAREAPAPHGPGPRALRAGAVCYDAGRVRIHRAPAPSRLPTGWGAAVALVLLWWVMAVSSVGQKSTTFDELAHLTAGYSYWLTGDFGSSPRTATCRSAGPRCRSSSATTASRLSSRRRGARLPDQPTTTPVNGNGATRAVSSTPAATSSRWNIGQAHGAFPPPDNGRPIEWFADTAYTTSCILFGPMGTPAPGFTWTAAAACVTPPLWPGPTRASCRAVGRGLNCQSGRARQESARRPDAPCSPPE